MRSVRFILASALVGFFATTAMAQLDTVRIGSLEIEGSLSEQTDPLAWLMGPGTPTLRDVVRALNEVAAGDDVDGLFIRLKDSKFTATQTEELGQALMRVRDSGKKVHMYAYGYGTTDLMLASYADDVMLQDGGAVMFPGMYMEEMYLADTLGLLGLKADMVQIGDYKGASEALMRSGPSPEWEQNITGLLDSMYANIRQPILSGRKLNDAGLDKAMSQLWLANGVTAKNSGVIDRVVDLPAIEKALATHYGAKVEWQEIKPTPGKAAPDLSNPFALFAMLMEEPKRTPKRATIAVVHINGPIIDGDSSMGGMMGSPSVGSRTIRKALSEIETNDLVKGVVIRINSPGGSAIASEVIWQGVRRVAEKKPVWVSVGNMAASGGYYIAVSGDRIYVNPSSIVGSIGVVGGKITLGGLYDKVDVHVVGRSRGPLGGMMSSSKVWTSDEREFVRNRMRETYDLFAGRVRQGRTGIDLSRVAEGRLFTGNNAVGLQMADEVGTLDDTLVALSSHLGLSEGRFDVMDYPGPMSLQDFFEQTFGGMISAPGVVAQDVGKAAALGLIREAVGDAAWPMVRDSLSAMGQLRTEPVLLVMPSVFVVR